MCLSNNVCVLGERKNRKKELAQLFEWQGLFPEGSIQSIMVLNRNRRKLYSFMETSEASF